MNRAWHAPAREAGGLPGIGGTQRAAGMGAIGVHRELPLQIGGPQTTGGPAVCQAAAAGESNRFQNGTRRTTLLSGSLWEEFMSKNIIFCADGTWNGPANGPGNGPGTADGDGTAGRTHQCLQTVHQPGRGKTRRTRHCSLNEQERVLCGSNGAPTQWAKYLHGVGDSGNYLGEGAGRHSRCRADHPDRARLHVHLAKLRTGRRIFITGFSRGAYTARHWPG